MITFDTDHYRHESEWGNWYAHAVAVDGNDRTIAKLGMCFPDQHTAIDGLPRLRSTLEALLSFEVEADRAQRRDGSSHE